MQKIAKFVRLIDVPTKSKGEWVAYDYSSDTVCVGITITKADYSQQYFQYESYEVYHISGWAERQGLEAEFCEVEVNLPD